MAVVTALLVVIAIGYAWWIVKGHRWYLKVRRRRGGIYLVRTQRHRLRPRWLSWLGMRENGYVGLTVSYHLRQKDHLGTGRHGAKAKDWSDLKPIWYKIIPLPWWLCWHWFMNPLETLVIRVTAPRYNDAKNRWNPRRIPARVAKAQRLERDRIRSVWGPPPIRRIDHG
jgi:hypothetical protein